MVARPNLRFALSHPAHFLALGFGSGIAPFAPGTFGTLLALPIFWYLEPRLKPPDFLILLGCSTSRRMDCDKTGRDMGIEDQGDRVGRDHRLPDRALLHAQHAAVAGGGVLRCFACSTSSNPGRSATSSACFAGASA
jgi:hypothetical protein